MESSQTDSLENIENQRLALEKLLSITRDIECLRSGFTSITYLDRLNYEITDEIRLYLKFLDGEIINSSDPALIELLRSMDHRVTKSLHALLGKTVFDTNDGDELLPDYSDDFAKEITEFRKNTHTSIGIRVLLNRRGLDTPPFKLAVPVKSIRQKIQILKEKEDKHKHRINSQIDSLLQNVSEVLQDTTLSEELKEHIMQVHSNLQQKKQHLESGKNLSDIPITVESVILKSDTPEVSPLTEPITEIPAAVQPGAGRKPDHHRKANGLLERVFLWINSSWKVSWKDTKYQ